MVVNGQFPGPLIEANEGDTIVVNVQNDLTTGAGIRMPFYLNWIRYLQGTD
jgi:FtsP/CotA-like multicopper oxidase with cupredoxin domain